MISGLPLWAGLGADVALEPLEKAADAGARSMGGSVDNAICFSSFLTRLRGGALGSLGSRGFRGFFTFASLSALLSALEFGVPSGGARLRLCCFGLAGAESELFVAGPAG